MIESNNMFVLAITGPTGSGKTTVAEKLASTLDSCANIDADHIKHMIPSGFYEDDLNPGGVSFDQWEIVGESIGLMASNFLLKGFDVIINGYIDEPAWVEIQKHVTLTSKVLLLPELDVVIARDDARSLEVRMGEQSVKRHHKYFSNDSFFDDFIKLDTTNQTVEETVAEVLKLLNASTSWNL